MAGDFVEQDCGGHDLHESRRFRLFLLLCNCCLKKGILDKKRPPLSVLLTSGWKLLKHTKLLLPGMKLYKTAMAEVDRVFPDQRSEWFVVQLGIEPSFQARGIGKCLLTTVTKWAEEQGTRVNALVFHHRQVWRPWLFDFPPFFF